MLDKLAGLFVSKRMIALALGAAVSYFAEMLGLDQEMANQFRTLMIAWAAGDAIRTEDNPFYSRRFWATIFAGVSILLAARGIVIGPETIEMIIWPIIAAILGDSVRETMSATQKLEQMTAKTDEPPTQDLSL